MVVLMTHSVDQQQIRDNELSKFDILIDFKIKFPRMSAIKRPLYLDPVIRVKVDFIFSTLVIKIKCKS